MSDHDIRLSKLVAHALRHEPWLYELELDESGWVALADLVTAIQGTPGYAKVQADDVQRMVATSPKQRYELSDGKIRALYGHSVPGRIIKRAATPPEQLYHGTSPAAWARIQRDGLIPMGRQYVHLAVSQDMAQQVGRRKAAEPVILRIHAAAAGHDGIPFWQGNDLVWLADRVPAQFITPADHPERLDSE
jgi:putative RNA 2'-phosphotransferase